MLKTLKFLKRDIQLGIINRFFIYAIVLVFSFAMVNECASLFDSIKEMRYMQSNGTIMDYYIYSVKGMEYYRFDPQEGFSIPLLWFVFQIGISYFVAYYAEKDYSENGINVITAGKNRVSWWVSKMIWCAISVMIYYLLTFISCALFALVKGADFSLKNSYDFMQIAFGYNVKFVSYSELMFIAVVLPLIMTIGICLVELLLSFVLSPVVSFACVCGVYVLSAYYTAWFLPGSFTMWIRSAYYDERGISPFSGLIIAGVLVITVFLVGRELFKSKDIM